MEALESRTEEFVEVKCAGYCDKRIRVPLEIKELSDRIKNCINPETFPELLILRARMLEAEQRYRVNFCISGLTGSIYCNSTCLHEYTVD